MFDADFDALDLGSRRKPTQWVAVAQPVPAGGKPPKRSPSSRRNYHKIRRRCSDSERKSPSNEFENARSSSRSNDDDERDPDVKRLDAEIEEGNIEYKLRLRDPNPIRFQQLVTQMKFRLSEGCGECFYYIGVEDDGYPRGLDDEDLGASIAVIKRMADSLRATASLKESFLGGFGLQCAIVAVRRAVIENVRGTEVRVVVAGTIDCGKSTLIAVLTHGSDGRPLLDNGLGSARTNVLRHKHEIESGRTSSINEQLLGYDDEGRVLNYVGVAAYTPEEIGTAASHQVKFIDMGGHEKFLKTAFYGLTSMLPDYMLLCISAVSGIGRVTREHLAVALTLDIPFAILITKCDMTSQERVQQVHQKIVELLETADTALRRRLEIEAFEKMSAQIVTGEAEASRWGHLISNRRQQMDEGEYSVPLSVPVFLSSSFTGSGLHLLHGFLGSLRAQPIERLSSSSSEGSGNLDLDGVSHFQVDRTFDVERVGLVLAGTAVDGSISVGQSLHLGPDDEGRFTPVRVESIQRSQIPVKTVRAGQTATLAVSETQSSDPDLPDELSFDYLHSEPRQQQTAPNPDEVFRIQPVEEGGSPGVKDTGILDVPKRINPRSTSSPPPSPTASSLKGTVLLDPAFDSTTVWEFEAVMVLLGGHWPPRGLLSGKWPPNDDLADSGNDSQDGGSTLEGRPVRGQMPRSRSRRKLCMYAPVIHVGSIRQPAQVLSMEEIPDENKGSGQGLALLPASFSAATAVATISYGDDESDECALGGDLPWCIARVRFRFMSRPEWLREGIRLIARDRSEGYLSGIGLVARTFGEEVEPKSV